MADHKGDQEEVAVTGQPARQLATELKARRRALELEPEDVYAATGVSPTTIWRLENAKGGSYRSTLIKLLDFYGVKDSRERARLLALLAEQAKRRRGWLRPYLDVLPPAYAQLIGLEADAGSLYGYESLLIPGLLQTQAYATAVIAAGLPMATEQDVEQRVNVRMRRQEVLFSSSADKAPAMAELVIAEAALWPAVGGSRVMAEQLRALLTPPSTVQLQVIPNEAGAHPGMGSGSFTILRFPASEARDLAYVETLAGGLFREAEADLVRFWSIFDTIKEIAHTVPGSATLIEKAIRTHEGR